MLIAALLPWFLCVTSRRVCTVPPYIRMAAGLKCYDFSFCMQWCVCVIHGSLKLQCIGVSQIWHSFLFNFKKTELLSQNNSDGLTLTLHPNTRCTQISTILTDSEVSFYEVGDCKWVSLLWGSLQCVSSPHLSLDLSFAFVSLCPLVLCLYMSPPHTAKVTLQPHLSENVWAAECKLPVDLFAWNGSYRSLLYDDDLIPLQLL